MESRVMGNCHARFGAGENLEERICSLRLHIPPKGLPIAIKCFLKYFFTFFPRIFHKLQEK